MTLIGWFWIAAVVTGLFSMKFGDSPSGGTTTGGGEGEGIPSTGDAVEEDTPQFADPADDEDEEPSSAEGATETDTDDAGEEDQAADKESDTEEATEPSAQTATADPFDAEILGIAAQLGLTADAARAYGTVEALENAIDYHLSTQQTKAAAADKQKAEPGIKTELDSDEFGEVAKFGTEVKEVIGAMEQKIADLEKQLGEVRPAVGNIQQAIAAQRDQVVVNQMDAMFSKLGGDWKDRFGEGSMLQMDANSEPYKNRVQVIQVMGAIGNAQRSADPKTKIDPAKLFERGLAAVFTDESLTIKQRETAQKLAKRNGATTHPPGNRRGGKENRLSAAARVIDEFHAKMGVTPQAVIENDDDDDTP